jgi:RNA polymerase sigma-54 factor
MRQEMSQRLTPRMIQSMEILQLPLMALEERIEQELVSNPVLEIRDGELDGDVVTETPPEGPEIREPRNEGEETLVVQEQGHDSQDDFDRLERISEYLENEEFSTNSSFTHRVSGGEGERDKKLDALNNSPDRTGNLTDHLLNQWTFVECPPTVCDAGRAIINYIDEQGYLRTDLETIRAESKTPHTLEDVQTALKLNQTLEPAGVGARNIAECLLLQINALEEDPDNEDHDFELERKLVTDHLKDLEMNRYPQISKKLDRPIEDLKEAVRRLSRLHPHPGKQIGHDDAPPITPDAFIYLDEDTDRLEIRMSRDPSESLYIGGKYR